MLDHDPLADSQEEPTNWPPEYANSILIERAQEIILKGTKAALMEKLPEHGAIWTGLSEEDLILEFSDPDEKEKMHFTHGANFKMDGQEKFILLEPADSAGILQKLSRRLRVETARNMLWAYVMDTLRKRLRAVEHQAEDEEGDDDEDDFGSSLDALENWKSSMESDEDKEEEDKQEEYEEVDLGDDGEEIVVDVMKKAEFESMCRDIASECKDLRRLYADVVNGQVSYPE